MTLKSLLRDIKGAIKVMGAVDSALLVHEDRERRKLIQELPSSALKPKQPFPELFHMNSIRLVFNSILADLSTASTLVSLYGAVLSGQPLPFYGIDLYSVAMEEDTEATVAAFFAGHKNGMSGLEGLLRETGQEGVMDDEVFATYRAMGCQTFSMWEVSVHRIVTGTCSEAEKLAREMGVQVDQVLAREAAEE